MELTIKTKRDAYLYNLRGNNILAWADKLQAVNKYKNILKKCTMDTTLELESGIVKLNPLGYYIGHEYATHVKAGIKFLELATILKYEVVKFEAEYGEVNLTENQIEQLRLIAYAFNKHKAANIDMEDAKGLIHLEQTAEVLYYLLKPSIIFDNKINGWCSLTFTNEGNLEKEYCTIFNESQLETLEEVSNEINRTSK